ncbi:MAG: TrkA C-terminal domain-containing protein [Thermomicrobiales bacterium]
MTDRIWEVLVLPASRVVGRTLRDTGLGAGYGVSVIATVRAGSTSAVSRTTAPIEAGDILLIGGRGERVRQIAERSNLELIGTPRSVSRFPLSEAELVEVIVPPVPMSSARPSASSTSGTNTISPSSLSGTPAGQSAPMSPNTGLRRGIRYCSMVDGAALARSNRAPNSSG